MQLNKKPNEQHLVSDKAAACTHLLLDDLPVCWQGSPCPVQLSLASVYARQAGSKLVHILLQAGKAFLAPHSLGNTIQQGLQRNIKGKWAA